jgi:hypothetical protein
MSEKINEYILNTTISKTALHTPYTNAEQILAKNVLIGDKLAAIDIDSGIAPEDFDAEELPEQTIVSKRKTITPKVNTNEVQAQTVYLAEGGAILFADEIDGTVTDNASSASGYIYAQSIPTTFSNGVCYDIGELSNATNLSHVSFSAAGRLIQTCELWFTTPATAPTEHVWPSGTYWIDSPTGAAPALLASKNYRVVFRQEPNKIIASIAYVY